ncbi:uncharacterized protein ACR2FA_006725 [Aphomia sociella]
MDAATEEKRMIKLGKVCTCSEIQDITGTHFVLNILCSVLERTEEFKDLDKIEWPPNPNDLKIAANFQGLGITTLAKLPPNSQVETLLFHTNGINDYWPDPFSEVPNLKTLSLYQNDLSAITSELFTKIDGLEDLDLSYNRLSTFSPTDFKYLKQLKRLNLQNNLIFDVPIKALIPLVSLEEIDLSRNSIGGELILWASGQPTLGLKRVSLSNNRITYISKNSFQLDNNIELLDLSYNQIQTIDEDAFLTCNKLQELNLANNNITFVFQLPQSLQIAILKFNTLYQWPQFPTGIKLIDLSNNRLSNMYDENRADFQNLEILDISGNQITDFNMEKKLPSLLNLDLAYNLFVEIPKSLNSEILPNLKVLRLDGNPMQSIYFKNIISLKTLYMNDMDKLKVVEDKAFSNVLGREDIDVVDSEIRVDPSSCFSLFLTNCKSLSEIRTGAFDSTYICMLDISSNNLTSLPRDLLDWSTVSEGVNLQSNPWHCTCDLEWMLDELLARMYDKYSNLLLDLRCGSPRAFEGLRLVHWYNWTEEPLCNEQYPRSGPRNTYMIEASSENYFPKVTTLTIVLSVSILISLFVAIGLMVYLVKTRKRHRAYQKRKRQSGADFKHFNGAEKREEEKSQILIEKPMNKK